MTIRIKVINAEDIQSLNTCTPLYTPDCTLHFGAVLFNWNKTSVSSVHLQPLDYESKRNYTLKVEATNIRSEPRSNGPFKDTATVKIVVEDSDEPPVFSKPMYLLEVDENAPINKIIGTVTARDPDATGSPIR